MFIRLRHYWFTASSLLILLTAGLAATIGLQPGIDFTGGSTVELAFSESVPTQDEVSAALVSVQTAELPDLSHARVRSAGEGSLGLGLPELSAAQHEVLVSALATKLPAFTETRFQTIGSLVSANFVHKALVGIAVAAVLITLFVAYAFRNVPPAISGWRMGVVAIVALLHDLALTTGAFIIMGHLFGWEADLLFITALLTVLGYSVNDTIIIFDRLRENFASAKDPEERVAELTQAALVETMGRSVNTTLSVVVVLLALVAFGADAIRPFCATLAFGIGVGAYSSIFIAAPLLVEWQLRVGKEK